MLDSCNHDCEWGKYSVTPTAHDTPKQIPYKLKGGWAGPKCRRPRPEREPATLEISGGVRAAHTRAERRHHLSASPPCSR